MTSRRSPWATVSGLFPGRLRGMPLPPPRPLQRCVHSRTFGHGATLGSCREPRPRWRLVPQANLVLRRVPRHERRHGPVRRDVMGTGFHAVAASAHGPARRRRARPAGRVGPAPCRSPPLRAAHVIRSTPSPSAWRSPAGCGAEAVHLIEEDPKAASRRRPKDGSRCLRRRRRRSPCAGHDDPPLTPALGDLSAWRLRRGRGPHGLSG